MRQEENSVSSKKVRLRPLAAPDVLEFKLPDQHCCIISDDGSHITMDLAAHLGDRGWRIVVLRYYDSQRQYTGATGKEGDGFGKAHCVTLTSDDESDIQQQLAAITSQYGPAAVFIHVHPHYPLSTETSVTFNQNSEKLLQQVFITAKHLQPMLNAAAQQPRSGVRACFMTVTQLDGGFGLRGERDIDVIAGGLSGLTKALALEWPEVYCRAVDVSPELASEAAHLVLAELNDPDRRYTEVGWHKMGRVTLEAL